MVITIRKCFVALFTISMLYWVVTLTAPVELVNDLVDGVLMGLAAACTYQYAHWAFTRPDLVLDRPTLLRVGIMLSWLATGGWRLERFLMQVRFMGYTGPVGVHDPLRGYMIVLLSLGATMHLLAFNMRPSAVVPNVDSPAVRIIAWASVAGLAFVVAMLLFYRHS